MGAVSKSEVILLNFIAVVYIPTGTLCTKFHVDLHINMDSMLVIRANRGCVIYGDYI